MSTLDELCAQKLAEIFEDMPVSPEASSRLTKILELAHTPVDQWSAPWSMPAIALTEGNYGSATTKSPVVRLIAYWAATGRHPDEGRIPSRVKSIRQLEEWCLDEHHVTPSDRLLHACFPKVDRSLWTGQPA